MSSGAQSNEEVFCQIKQKIRGIPKGVFKGTQMHPVRRAMRKLTVAVRAADCSSSYLGFFVKCGRKFADDLRVGA